MSEVVDSVTRAAQIWQDARRRLDESFRWKLDHRLRWGEHSEPYALDGAEVWAKRFIDETPHVLEYPVVYRRDVMIYELIRLRVTSRAVAAQYGLSTARVNQLVRIEARRREEVRRSLFDCRGDRARPLRIEPHLPDLARDDFPRGSRYLRPTVRYVVIS